MREDVGFATSTNQVVEGYVIARLVPPYDMNQGQSRPIALSRLFLHYHSRTLASPLRMYCCD